MPQVETPLDTATTCRGDTSVHRNQNAIGSFTLLALTVLLAIGPSSPSIAQATQSAPQTAAIRRYVPEFQRMQQASDWVGLEQLSRQALSAVELESGPDSIDVARAASWLAMALEHLDRKGEAELPLKRALAIDETAFGKEHRYTGVDLSNLADVLIFKGRYDEAEPLVRRALAIQEKTFGPEHPETAACLNTYAQLLQAQGRYAEAEPLYQRALAIDAKALGPDSPDTAGTRNNLASLLRAQGRYGEAEPLMKDALRVAEAVFGPDDFHTATALTNLAGLLEAQGRYGEAGPLYQRALRIVEKARGPEHPDTATHSNNVALFLLHQGQNADADPLFRRAVAIDEKVLGPRHPNTRHAHENLAENDEALGKYADATANYRLACTALSSSAGSRDQRGDTAQAVQSEASVCSMHYGVSLWGWAAQGGGSAPDDRPVALKLEAFAAAQHAAQSAAGDAMARSAAFAAAMSATVGPQARAYEAALLERDGLDRQFANAVGNSGPGAIEAGQMLAKSRDEATARIEGLEAELRTKAPLYWDFRSPAPVSVAALQAKAGADAALLHEDEALIAFLVIPGKDRGLVFAVSKQQSAWARLTLSGAALQARVIRLREQIDPAGYRLRGIVVTPDTIPSTASAPLPAPATTTTTAPAPAPAVFDRQAAYELYQALLGDPSIQAVIQSKAVLLFVPSGPLTSLPPGLLVTAPPQGGAALDDDAAALRSTAWLLRSKAVALLPAVSSLRTLRQILPASRAAPSDPLLAFADPDFHRATTAPPASADSSSARAGGAPLRGDLRLGQIMDLLPDLPGTRIEGEALQRALGAKPGTLLMGRDASKAQLMARNADGRLAQVRVLEFATHGLVAGDASDLAEPALVLAAGARPEDELLLASEAATLRLNADWVLLSACNTASPDAPEARGFSGLSRAFFYAGARSLLISHWEVIDAVAPVLIPALLRAERNNPHLGHAQALRQASLAILDDPEIAHGAKPYAWAPFTVVGEPAREPAR
jgi:CHAT domain-containing protein/Tfp pilus assembly protein PilF